MFDKLVNQVDDAVFNTVGEYMKEVMGGPFDQESHDTQSLIVERVLTALVKKYRPENVIFVEEEENVPEQVIYGVFTSEGTWLCDVSGSTEGELFADLVDAMNTYGDQLLMENEFEVGDDDILFECRRNRYILKKK
jgi:hypothetical protein